MIENLTKLYNTLLLIETRGESTKTMAKCLQYIELMVEDLKKANGHVENPDEKGGEH